MCTNARRWLGVGFCMGLMLLCFGLWGGYCDWAGGGQRTWGCARFCRERSGGAEDWDAEAPIERWTWGDVGGWRQALDPQAQ